MGPMTHGEFEWNFICNCQMDFGEWWVMHLLWNCPNMNVIGLHLIYIYIQKYIINLFKKNIIIRYTMKIIRLKSMGINTFDTIINLFWGSVRCLDNEIPDRWLCATVAWSTKSLHWSSISQKCTEMITFTWLTVLHVDPSCCRHRMFVCGTDLPCFTKVIWYNFIPFSNVSSTG